MKIPMAMAVYRKAFPFLRSSSVADVLLEGYVGFEPHGTVSCIWG